MVTRRQIVELLRAVGCPLKAREIAAILARKTGEPLALRDVNRVLYAMKDKDSLRKDSANCWGIASTGTPSVEAQRTASQVEGSFRVGRWPEERVVAFVRAKSVLDTPVSEAQVRKVLGIFVPEAPRTVAQGLSKPSQAKSTPPRPTGATGQPLPRRCVEFVWGNDGGYFCFDCNAPAILDIDGHCLECGSVRVAPEGLAYYCGQCGTLTLLEDGGICEACGSSNMRPAPPTATRMRIQDGFPYPSLRPN